MTMDSKARGGYDIEISDRKGRKICDTEIERKKVQKGPR